MLAAIEFPPAGRHLERIRTLHVNLKPVGPSFHFAQRHRLGVRVVFHEETVASDQTATLRHDLWNHNLALTGRGRRHKVSIAYRLARLKSPRGERGVRLTGTTMFARPEKVERPLPLRRPAVR